MTPIGCQTGLSGLFACWPLGDADAVVAGAIGNGSIPFVSRRPRLHGKVWQILGLESGSFVSPDPHSPARRRPDLRTDAVVAEVAAREEAHHLVSAAQDIIDKLSYIGLLSDHAEAREEDEMRDRHPLMATHLAARPDPLTAAPARGGTVGQQLVWSGAVDGPGHAFHLAHGSGVTPRCLSTNSPDTTCGFRAGRDCN